MSFVFVSEKFPERIEAFALMDGAQVEYGIEPLSTPPLAASFREDQTED